MPLSDGESGLHHFVLVMTKPERFERLLRLRRMPDPAAHLLDAHLARGERVGRRRLRAPSPGAIRMCAPSGRLLRFRPRTVRQSTTPRRRVRARPVPPSRGACRPSIAARTMLCGLVEPRLLVRMSLTPAHSSTARTAPPAMTPAPGAAGFSSTRPAPCLPTTSCGNRPAGERHRHHARDAPLRPPCARLRRLRSPCPSRSRPCPCRRRRRRGH